jgi:hypothetical protein
MNTTGVTPPPGCKVRGCCMGIPIGCGTFLLLLLVLSGVLTALRYPSGSPVAPVATGVQTEVHGPPDQRQESTQR